MRVRRFLTTVAAPLAVLAAVNGTAPVAAAATEPRAPDRPLRVMTFNIHHGAGADGRLDLGRIARVVDEHDVDVVGLQEVDRHWSARSDFVDQAAWLARELRMFAVYGANLDLDPAQSGQPRRQYGTAILSSVPIRDWDNTYLPRYEGHEQRGLLRARILVRGVSVQVYNTHLQHNDANERLDQVRAIEELIGTPDQSVVLLGDLNATPEAPEIRELVDGLVDSWSEAGVGDGYTYSSENPTKRIDYVMTSDDVVARTAAVVSSDPVASDHLPVVSDLLVPGDKLGARYTPM